MNILDPFSKTESSNQHVFVLIDQYANLNRAISVTAVSSTNATTIFIYIWVIQYGISACLLTEKGLQFVSKFFAAVTMHLGISHLKTTTYLSPTSGQVERFNKTIVARLEHYVAEHQTVLNQYVQLLTYE